MTSRSAYRRLSCRWVVRLACSLGLLGCGDERSADSSTIEQVSDAAAPTSSGDLPISIGSDERASRLDGSLGSLDAQIERMDADGIVHSRARDGSRCESACDPTEPLHLPVTRSIEELTRCEIEVCRGADCLRSGLGGLADALLQPSITLSFQSQLEDGGYLAVWLELREDNAGEKRLVFAWEPDAFDQGPTDKGYYAARLIAPDGSTVAAIEAQLR